MTEPSEDPKFIYTLPSGKGEGNQYREVPLEKPLPAPIGINCPWHPTYPLVWQGDNGFCRRGQHVVELSIEKGGDGRIHPDADTE